MDTPLPIKAGPAGKFVSARKIGDRRILFIDENGRDFIREGGSRAWRNFNPGNIRRGTFAKSAGSIGDDGAFAIFPDEDTGLEAVVTLLRSKSYNDLSLVDAVFKYAPPSENDSKTYAKFIEDQTGIKRTTVLSTLGIAEIRKIARTIRQIEGWSNGSEHPNMPPSSLSADTQAVASAAASASDWMSTAISESQLPANDRTQWIDPGENPRILNYFKVGAPWFDPVGGDEVDWCAAFVNYCLVTAGYIGTEHPGARSFFWNKKKQFVSLPAPTYGCVAVRRYDPFTDPEWKTGTGHVGFVVSSTATTVTLLGGNQSDTVRTTTFPLEEKTSAGKLLSKFVAFMMPVGN
ncbi:conjugal transfer protein (plasmid) [Rhizobium sp. TH2]|nr:conjugal transfer protein [Rhizobium sp. TH2]